MTIALLVLGYALAVPFTVWLPGFRRLWRRRELAVYGAAQGGALLITVGYVLRGNESGAAVNGGWLIGFAVAYGLEGRKRLRSVPPSAPAR